MITWLESREREYGWELATNSYSGHLPARQESIYWHLFQRNMKKKNDKMNMRVREA